MPTTNVGGPNMAINYIDGQPGSFFTITGWSYPQDFQASLFLNGEKIAQIPVSIYPTGGFILVVNTNGFPPGSYSLTSNTDPVAGVSFNLFGMASLHPQENFGPVLDLVNITSNYSSGKPGSLLHFTGFYLPFNANFNILINDQVISPTLQVDAGGNISFLLDTTGADPGYYLVKIKENPGIMTYFMLAEDTPIRIQEGSGQVILLPKGIAYDYINYLPLVR